MTKHRLGVFGIALMYVGTIMGAGFASGREIWQFFGVFGKLGYIGVILVGLLFAGIGIMTGKIARTLNTNEMGRVIVPGGNQKLTDFVSGFMALILFTVLVTMSAAGGALFHQQFGQSRILGGAFIITLVILTVIGGFERMSKVFRYIMPALAIVVVSISLIIIFGDFPPSGITAELIPSPLASTWFLAAPLYISYNILAAIPIVSTASIRAKNQKTALAGASLGGVFLGLLAILLMTAMQTDMSFSQTMDMPMLALSQRISKVANLLYILVLFFAIYASATSNYYGLTTALKPSPYRNLKIIAIPWIGFAFGLFGFTNVVAYMLPIEGFLGFIIIAMIAVNFYLVCIKKSTDKLDEIKNKQDTKLNIETPDVRSVFGEFEGHDRFGMPDGVVRVTSGQGGEAFLVFGSEKTALFDCGMAYCGGKTVKNIEAAFDIYREQYGDRTLDYVILSHTHYDHVGALPYVRRNWPQALVLGAAYAKAVFEKPGAVKVMRELGEKSRDEYTDSREEILTEGLAVDRIVGDGDEISLGVETVKVLETPGHTNCSLAFALEPAGILFASESTGVLENPNHMHTAILKSYRDSMDSLEKCRAYDPKRIISPHFGIVPQSFNHRYWELFQESAEEKRVYLHGLYEEGLGLGEMLERYTDHYWVDKRANEQPKAAFMLNAENIIKVIVKEFE